MGTLYGRLTDMEGKSFEIPAIFKLMPGNFQTTADINGYYSINVPDGNYEIFISHRGLTDPASGEKRFGIKTIIENINVIGNTEINFISRRLNVGISSVTTTKTAAEGEDVYVYFLSLVRNFDFFWSICVKIIDIDTNEILSYGCAKDFANNSHIFNMPNKPLYLRLILEETENGDFCSVDWPVIEYSINRTNRNIFSKLKSFQYLTGSYMDELINQGFDYEFEIEDIGLFGFRLINLLNGEIVYDYKSLSFIFFPDWTFFRDDVSFSEYDHLFLRLQTYHMLWYGTKEEILDEEYDIIIRNNERYPPENWPPIPT